MDLYPRVVEMRQRALAWLASMEAPELGFGVHADSAHHRSLGWRGMYLPGTYNAVCCRILLGDYTRLEPQQAAALADFLNRFQRHDGAFRIPEMKPDEIFYPDFEYIDLHTTNYTLGALALVGAPPRQPFAFIARYNTPQKLAAWLDARDLADPWREGNYIVNIASFYAWLLEQGETQYQALLERLLEWHLQNQEPRAGYWYDPATRDLTSAMAGAAHNLHLFYYLDRPVPRFRAIVDHCLGILGGVSSACLDIDIVDILANLYHYGYRQGEIEACLERKLAALLDFQNPDGGFADVRQGVRLFDGWERYQEPQGHSNCFSTWFRCTTVAMICRTLYPDSNLVWRFRSTLGMGYFNPRAPQQPPPALEPAPSEPPIGALPRSTAPSAETAFGPAAARAIQRVNDILAALDPARLSAAAAVYQVELTGPEGGVFHLEIAAGRFTAAPGDHPGAAVWIETSPERFDRLLDGRLNTTAAYMTRKLKIRGDISLAMKLDALLR